MRPVSENWSKADDRLIWFINEERIFPRVLGEDPYSEWERLVELYEKNVN